jgi:hypothetical protein
VAFIEAFRRRGIFPRNVRSLSEESLRWEGPDLTVGYEDAQVYLGHDLKEQMHSWNLRGGRDKIFEQSKEARRVAEDIIDRSRGYKQKITSGLNLDLREFDVHSIRPVRRTGPDGQLLMDVVVEITQQIPGFFDKARNQCPPELSDEKKPDFWYRGGCTLIIDLDTGKLRYCIYKRIDSETRYDRQRAFLSGRYASPSLHATYFGTSTYEEREEVFSFLHRSYEEVV